MLVGHSMGAQVVIEAAARHPDLTERIVLVGPTVNDRERTAREQIRRLAQDLAHREPQGDRRSALASTCARARTCGRKMRAMLVHEPERSLPRVPRRTLVIRGEDDLVVPQDWCERLVALRPDGTPRRRCPAHGHETMIRDAEPTARLILDVPRAGPATGRVARAATAIDRSDPDSGPPD